MRKVLNLNEIKCQDCGEIIHEGEFAYIGDETIMEDISCNNCHDKEKYNIV